VAQVHIEGAATIEVVEGDTVLRAALRAGLGFPYACNTGSCGNCRFTLLEGEVEHLRDDAPAWSDRDRERGRWLGCQAMPLSDLRVKVRLEDTVPPHRPRRRPARLVEVLPVTHDMSEFVLEVEGSDAFEPGQYALFHLEGVDGDRGYSMCNLPGSGEWRFQVRRVPDGRATTVLFDGTRPGDVVVLDGPYGNAYLRPEGPGDLLLVAGGAGLSPMLSIVRAALRDHALADREIRFFHGGRHPEDLCAERFLGELPGFGERLQLMEAVSEPSPGWAGPTGFIHEVVHREVGARLPGFEAYFAGPPPMVKAMQAMLFESGLTPDRMHFDEFF
jgi:toluene monooxygenase electron transfer component